MHPARQTPADGLAAPQRIDQCKHKPPSASHHGRLTTTVAVAFPGRRRRCAGAGEDATGALLVSGPAGGRLAIGLAADASPSD
jgi:hypothetical protein